MKKYLNLTTCLAIITSLSLNIACTSDERNEGIKKIHEPVRLTVGLGNISITRAATTNANIGSWNNPTLVSTDDNAANLSTIGNYWNANVIVNIRTKEADATTDATKSYKVAAGSGAQALSPSGTGATDQFYWGSTGESKTVIAWSIGTTASLSTANLPDQQDFSVVSDQSSGIGQELLYAYGQTITQGSSNNIDLYHQMTKLTIKVISATDGVTALTIGSNDAVAANKVSLAGKFTAPTTTNYGTWAAPTVANQGYITARMMSKGANESSPGVEDATNPQITTFEAVVIPADYAGQAHFFDIVYAGAHYFYTGVATDDDLSGAAGKNVIYTVTITTSGIQTTATIQDWTSGGSKTGSATL